MNEAQKSKRAYHHGNLREALIAEAVRIIEADGPAALNLRHLARRLGVSHAAPAHHFPDKTALLTAVAAHGYDLLASELEGAREQGFLEAGLAYVRFAVNNPGHVKVMFEASLYNEDDAVLQAARQRSRDLLYRSAGSVEGAGDRRVGLAGWCLMHGFALLWLQGNLRDTGSDPESVARWLAQATFGGPSGRSREPAG